MSTKLTKRVNPFLILFGLVFVLILQTWVSVLNAQQAYLMSEARNDEAKINRVLTRMDELNNNLSNPEYLYYQAYDSDMRILLTPHSLSNDVFKTWEGSLNADSLEEVKDDANNFLGIYDSLLPERGKKYFVPIRDNLEKTLLKHPLDFIETLASGVNGVRVGMGENFNGENTNGDIKTDSISDLKFDKINATNSDVLDNQSPVAAPNSEVEARNFGGDLPAPVTH